MTKNNDIISAAESVVDWLWSEVKVFKSENNKDKFVSRFLLELEDFNYDMVDSGIADGVRVVAVTACLEVLRKCGYLSVFEFFHECDKYNFDELKLNFK